MILGKTVEGAPVGCEDKVEWLYWLQAFAFFIQLQHYYAFTSWNNHTKVESSIGYVSTKITVGGNELYWLHCYTTPS